MKIQIRKNVFETNSSSTHSIVIAKSSKVEEMIATGQNMFPDVVINFRAGEYGWGYGRYESVNSRASYLYTGLVNGQFYKEWFPKLTVILDKYNIQYEFIDEVVEKSWSDGEKYVDFNTWGYVDHSYELKDFIEAVCSDEYLLLNYLFCDDSLVATGNDNDDAALDDSCDGEVIKEFYKGN